MRHLAACLGSSYPLCDVDNPFVFLVRFLHFCEMELCGGNTAPYIINATSQMSGGLCSLSVVYYLTHVVG